MRIMLIALSLCILFSCKKEPVAPPAQASNIDTIDNDSTAGIDTMQLIAGNYSGMFIFHTPLYMGSGTKDTSLNCYMSIALVGTDSFLGVIIDAQHFDTTYYSLATDTSFQTDTYTNYFGWQNMCQVLDSRYYYLQDSIVFKLSAACSGNIPSYYFYGKKL